MITDDLTNKDLAYLKIIHTELNLCLTADAPHNTTAISLQECSDNTSQYFFFEKVVSKDTPLEFKSTESPHLNYSSSDEFSTRLFGIKPQFYGKITAVSKPEYCISINEKWLITNCTDPSLGVSWICSLNTTSLLILIFLVSGSQKRYAFCVVQYPTKKHVMLLESSFLLSAFGT